jgi:hypothetical protein
MFGLSAVRNLSRLILLGVPLATAACAGIEPTGFSGDIDALLSRGNAYLERLSRETAVRLTDPQVVALGYAERARLGLGSPFRLIDYALRDPLLPDTVRQHLAYGLLARTLRGETYAIDPRVLDVGNLFGAAPDRSHGDKQLALVERTLEAAPNAAVGERAIRLGYLLAAAERTVEPGYEQVIAHVGAMVADRRRAREDAARLLRTAARQGEDPLRLLQRWRRDFQFTVEQPPLTVASVRDEEAEARDGLALALALRTLAQRLSAPVSLVESATPPAPANASILAGAVAERLRVLALARDYPAQAPVAVAVDINREGFLSRRDLDDWRQGVRKRFLEEVWNEERLAASAAILQAAGADLGQRPALILLQAATFLRVWNQEEPWFPGDQGPAARDLEARFGLAAVRFDADIDDGWRPYYLRMLGRSLADLQRVVPAYSLRGLTIVIGELPRGVGALALHEPRTRTLYLPPRTAAGTLAHELAHDLDWQLARRRYGARGGYATDLAVRDRRGDRIAVAMMELSASLAQPATGKPAAAAHGTRPAEVFARGVDWLVAATLARDGRLGGYLTSFQDPVLTGYGTTRGPDISGGAVPALLAILSEVAPVVDSTREWALNTYGPSRSLTGMEVAHVIADAGSGLLPAQRLRRIENVGARSVRAVGDCRVGSVETLTRMVQAQRLLAEASVRAAARGAAIDAVHLLAEEHVGADVQPRVDAWLVWRLYGAPEPADSLLSELAPAFEDLLLQAELAERADRPAERPNAFHQGRDQLLCEGNPFAATTAEARFRRSLTGVQD